MQHHLDVDLAVRYGMVEAILINHFEYWIELNRTNGRNFYDGRYWTFNSMKALSEIFPYLTEKKIRTALKNLQDEGLILTGNYNRSAYDRTLWYAFSDFAKCILPKRQMEDASKANGSIQNGEPIPDNNPVDNPPNKPNENVGRKRPPARFVPPTVEKVAAYCKERNNGIDAQHFVDYYSANGWVQGKGKPIKDWNAAVRTWERNGNGKRAEESRPQMGVTKKAAQAAQQNYQPTSDRIQAQSDWLDQFLDEQRE